LIIETGALLFYEFSINRKYSLNSWYLSPIEFIYSDINKIYTPIKCYLFSL
jgi:hypothetical protein